MASTSHTDHVRNYKSSLLQLNLSYLKSGCTLPELKASISPPVPFKITKPSLTLITLTVLLSIAYNSYKLNHLTLLTNYLLGIRCIFPNNYFIWEATRPITNCSICTNIKSPIILLNATKETFAPFAYTSIPVVVRGAFLDWPAREKFSLRFFQELYERIEDGARSVDEECQFLHFKSDFISIRDVFQMGEERAGNAPGENSWYVGWGNCHPGILDEMRKYYPKPHFLPEDCEIPAKEYVFMGYDEGATMHLDFINRLMWQAQLQGSKTWHLLPPPECQEVCSSFSFLVNPGDAVLVDTRIWYHATTIAPGEFSLSIQSEYG